MQLPGLEGGGLIRVTKCVEICSAAIAHRNKYPPVSAESTRWEIFPDRCVCRRRCRSPVCGSSRTHHRAGLHRSAARVVPFSVGCPQPRGVCRFPSGPCLTTPGAFAALPPRPSGRTPSIEPQRDAGWRCSTHEVASAVAQLL